ncbi:hypothetical protein NL676_014841 [Syzygium grande]|nr:hypothetical protein NL676_014841 [Syzygium grande]
MSAGRDVSLREGPEERGRLHDVGFHAPPADASWPHVGHCALAPASRTVFSRSASRHVRAVTLLGAEEIGDIETYFGASRRRFVHFQECAVEAVFWRSGVFWVDRLLCWVKW